MGKVKSELFDLEHEDSDHWVDAENGKRYKEYFLQKAEIKRLKRGNKK